MEMPLPDNTLPMMTGRGPFGPVEMGGMFSTVKVRRNLARDDYRDPGWYRAPAGTVAREWQGETPRHGGRRLPARLHRPRWRSSSRAGIKGIIENTTC
jgi:hypothetical protein